ncbi:MAG: DnaD domain protein [Eubacterium sp.]|nr:DnaD domain protein [Eubacterium sp.]
MGLTLTNKVKPNYTLIPNEFIVSHMPGSHGDYVKIYVYLLSLDNQSEEISISKIADILQITESDVIRGLKYWNAEGVLDISMDGDEVTSISIVNLDSAEEESPVEEEKTVNTVNNSVNLALLDDSDSELKFTGSTTKQVSVPKKKHYDPAVFAALSNDLEIKKCSDGVENMLGHTFNPKYVESIIYLMSELGLSSELVMEAYKIAVVDKKIESIEYIEQIAINWKTNNIKTVQEARDWSAMHYGLYNTVKKALAIKGELAPAVKEKIDNLLNYGYGEEFIRIACDKEAVMHPGNPSIPYVDAILYGWKKKGVKTIEDIEKCDKDHKEESKKKYAQKSASGTFSKNGDNAVPAQRKNAFHNYTQRSYTEDELKARERRRREQGLRDASN